MAIKGRDRYENLSFQGGDRPGPPVRFGDFVVPTAVAWLRDPIGREPGIRAEFEMRGGQPVCVSLVFQVSPGGRPITTSDLATLPGLDRKGIDAFQAFATKVLDDEDWRQGKNLHRIDEIRNPKPQLVRAALKSRSDAELKIVAETYRENVDAAPLQAVMALLDVSQRTASRRVESARERGFLSATTQGKRST